MAESLVLFESVINSRWFLRTSIILFMNKIDLFAAKLTKIPLEKFFTDYTGKRLHQYRLLPIIKEVLGHTRKDLNLYCYLPCILVNFQLLWTFFVFLLGGPDISRAAKYILWRFTQTNRARLHIYPQ